MSTGLTQYGPAFDEAVKKCDWRKQLGIILTRHNHQRAHDERAVSSATVQKRQEIINQSFEALRQLGYKLPDVRSFRLKHVEELIKHWLENDLSTAVIHNRISALRTYSRWIGKGDMLPGTDILLPAETGKSKRTYIATEDKSWESNGVDIAQVISLVSAYDPWVGMQLKLMQAFGLRRKEAIMFQPHLVEEDDGSGIQIYKGTKGGRFRRIPYSDEEQRQVIRAAKALVTRKNGYVANPDNTLEQNIRRFNYVLERFGLTKSGEGVTSHGLRHQFANDRFEEQTGGRTTPVRGENTEGLSKEQIDHVRYRIAEELGHGRISITNSYYGKFSR